MTNTQSGMFLKKFSINASDDDVEETVAALGDDLEEVAAVVHTQAGNKERDRMQDKRLPAGEEGEEARRALGQPRPRQLRQESEEEEASLPIHYARPTRSQSPGQAREKPCLHVSFLVLVPF